MRKAGFTLLEMVVVIMIVSVLLLLTVPNVSRVIDSVDDNACAALAKVADAAIVEFKLEYGQYPNSINDLVAAGYLDANQISCSNGRPLYIADGHVTY